jgi:hypothetical protein
MKLRIGTMAVLLSFLFASDTPAHPLTCPAGKHVDINFGAKATLQLVIPLSQQQEFARALRSYAAQKNLTYWSAHEPSEWQTIFILHSKKSGVFISIGLADEEPSAEVYINRNCIPDQDDWLPYWVDFKAFVASGRYKMISN